MRRTESVLHRRVVMTLWDVGPRLWVTAERSFDIEG